MSRNFVPPAVPVDLASISALLDLIRILVDPERTTALLQDLEHNTTECLKAINDATDAFNSATSKLAELKAEQERVNIAATALKAEQEAVAEASKATGIAVKDARAMQEEAKQVLANARATIDAKMVELASREEAVRQLEVSVAHREQVAARLIVDYEAKVSNLQRAIAPKE